MPQLEGDQQIEMPEVVLLVSLVSIQQFLDVLAVCLHRRLIAQKAVADVVAHAHAQPFVNGVGETLLLPVHDALGWPFPDGFLVQVLATEIDAV